MTGFVPIPKPFYAKAKICGKVHDVCVIAARAMAGHMLGFKCHLKNGAVYYPVYAHQIAVPHTDEEPVFYDDTSTQEWNCFSDSCAITVIPYLEALTGGECMSTVDRWRQYIFTVDFGRHDNAFVDEPTQYKCLHAVLAENGGTLMLLPNNKLTFEDCSFTEKTEPKDMGLKVNTSFDYVEETHGGDK